MATSHHHVTLSNALAFACAMCHYLGLFQTPSPGGTGQALVPFYPPQAALTDVHDVPPSPPGSPSFSFDGDWTDATEGLNTPKSGMVQSGFVWLHHLVVTLFLQFTVVASDVVSLKDRITAVEGTQMPAVPHGQETEALVRQFSALCKRVSSQEDRTAVLELSHRAATESYQKTIQELIAKLEGIKVDDGKKSHDDALASLGQSVKNLQYSMEGHGARITGVKADTALKISLLQSELAGVQAELAALKAVAMPIDASSTSPAAKEVRKTRIFTSVAQQKEDAKEEETLCPLPPVVARSSAGATVSQDTPRAPTSSSGSPIMSLKYTIGKTEETTVKNIGITKEPLTIAHANVARPGADKIPAMPTIPIPPIPMGRLIPAKSNGKENRSYNSSTPTLQDTQLSQPSTGQSPDVKGKGKPFTVSPDNKGQPVAGLPSKASAPPKPRKSTLPEPRKSLLPSLTKHVVVDGGSSNEVKAADRLPGGSATQTKQPKTVEFASVAMSRPFSDSALVEKSVPTVLPTSSSLAALDAALQVTWMEDENLLTITPAFNCLDDDLSFSAITSTPKPKNIIRDYRRECIYIPSKREKADVKPLRSSLKTTSARLTENKGSSPTSSSLTTLDATLQALHSQGDILTLVPVPDYASGDLSSSPAVIPIFKTAKPHCKRESIYVSPKRTSTVKPSRRL